MRFVKAHWWVLAGVAAVAVGGVVGGALIGLSWLWVVLLVVLVAGGAVALLEWTSRRSGDGGDQKLSVGVVAAHFGFVAIVVFGAIQLLPYGRDHSNPPITGEPHWSSPRTRELMVNACYGCHSNEVEWPWYASIAPISWAVSDHVNEGRDAVNYSEFATDPGEAEESIEVILDGSMPPGYYTLFGLHPEADLSDGERAELVAGLRTTPGLSEADEQDEQDEEDESDEQDEVDEEDEVDENDEDDET